ncbi:MAG: epoxide hydrolase N-terminal domain-containing protein, partial [Micropepsaceae bacterium]
MKPFSVSVSKSEIDDLKARLQRVRWPNEPAGNAAWDWGTNLSYMKRLIAYWRDTFDWGRAEAELNRFPQFTVDLAAGGETHTVHF